MSRLFAFSVDPTGTLRKPSVGDALEAVGSRILQSKGEYAFDATEQRPNLGSMLDDTPNYLKLAYEEWFDDHPESLAEIKTTTVRLQRRQGGPITYVKNTAGGDVQISKEEFDARYWARERGTRPGK
jgi:hypothetical protein